MYRWDDPHQWLEEKLDNGEISVATLKSFVLCSVSTDSIEDWFGADMDNDGYYSELERCACCGEYTRISWLETCIVCLDRVCEQCIHEVYREDASIKVCDKCYYETW